MEIDWQYDPTKHLQWPWVNFQQTNDEWIVQSAPNTIYFKQADADRWQSALGYGDEFGNSHAFYASHFVIEGDQLIAYGEDAIDSDDRPVRVVVNLSTGTLESYELIDPSEIEPTNLTMERFTHGAPLDRRTPSVDIYHSQAYRDAITGRGSQQAITELAEEPASSNAAPSFASAGSGAPDLHNNPVMAGVTEEKPSDTLVELLRISHPRRAWAQPVNRAIDRQASW